MIPEQQPFRHEVFPTSLCPFCPFSPYCPLSPFLPFLLKELVTLKTNKGTGQLPTNTLKKTGDTTRALSIQESILMHYLSEEGTSAKPTQKSINKTILKNLAKVKYE